MKNYVVVLIAVFSLSLVHAQENVKDTYVLNGDLIEATLYHDNGVVAQTGSYSKEGKLQGQWTSYDAEGNKTAVAQYDNGAKVGTWFFYIDEDMKEVIYRDSQIAEVRTWKVTNARVVSN